GWALTNASHSGWDTSRSTAMSAMSAMSARAGDEADVIRLPEIRQRRGERRVRGVGPRNNSGPHHLVERPEVKIGQQLPEPRLGAMQVAIVAEPAQHPCRKPRLPRIGF